MTVAVVLLPECWGGGFTPCRFTYSASIAPSCFSVYAGPFAMFLIIAPANFCLGGGGAALLEVRGTERSTPTRPAPWQGPDADARAWRRPPPDRPPTRSRTSGTRSP